MDFTRADSLTPEIEAEIEKVFDYQPWSDEMIARGKLIREALVQATKVLIRNAPPSPDRSAAIRKIREARMDANSAITHAGKY